jgi:hypothetical protein
MSKKRAFLAVIVAIIIGFSSLGVGRAGLGFIDSGFFKNIGEKLGKIKNLPYRIFNIEKFKTSEPGGAVPPPTPTEEKTLNQKLTFSNDRTKT